MAVKGRRPIAVLKVTVGEAFLHCAKALLRARLWEPDARIERSRFPTDGAVPADRTAGADAAEISPGEKESARTELYGAAIWEPRLLPSASPALRKVKLMYYPIIRPRAPASGRGRQHPRQ